MIKLLSSEEEKKNRLFIGCKSFIWLELLDNSMNPWEREEEGESIRGGIHS